MKLIEKDPTGCFNTGTSAGREGTIQAAVRACSVCGYVVKSPFTLYCPRCATEVPRDESPCRGCVYGKSCPSVADP